MRIAVRRSPNKLWRFNFIFSLCFHLSHVDLSDQGEIKKRNNRAILMNSIVEIGAKRFGSGPGENYSTINLLTPITWINEL